MDHTSKTIDGIEYHVNHNSDWSGTAIILWEEKGQRHECELPGALLRACGRDRAFRDAIAALEQLEI
jgi:hypothetical protein